MEQDRSALPGPKNLRCSSCSAFKACLFHLPRHGGFKDEATGTGRNVAYRLICSKTDGSGAKEDFAPCDVFVMVLQDRMLEGEARIRAGMDGERIRILGNDSMPGLTVRQPCGISLNTRGEVIKPLPALIEPLKKAGFTINETDLSDSKHYRTVMLDVPVPKFVGRVKGSSIAAQELYERERQDEEATKETDEAAWAEAQERIAKEAAGEIVPKRGPGRPRKVLAEPVQP